MAVLLGGCGPGLLALAGGSGGGIFAFQGGKKDGGGGGGGSNNTPPAVVITAITREESPARINYTLIDAESDLCSIVVTYSTDGTNFSPCTSVGGDGTTFLNSGSAGANHVFEWDYAADLQDTGLTAGVTITITPNDGSAAGAVASLGMGIVGNDAPVILNPQPPTADSPSAIVNGPLVLVTFKIADSSADISGVVVGYTLDQGQTYTQLDPFTDFVGTPPSALLTSPTGTLGQFIWNSAVDLPSFASSDVRLVLIPVDRPNGWVDYTIGTPVGVGPFALNNIADGPPEINLITNIDGTTQVGRIGIQFTLTDAGSDSAEVDVEYSTNGGTSYLPATLTGQSSPQPAGPYVCTPSPRLYFLEWDALADLQSSASFPDVRLRLTPRQFGMSSVVGLPATTGLFLVVPNEAPQVTDFQVFQSSGNITVRVRLSDSSGDPVDCTVRAVYAGPGSPFTIPDVDITAADIHDLNSSVAGEDNLMVWNTTAAGSPFATSNNTVVWEIVPTDIPSSWPAAALTGPIYSSPPFAVINDFSALVPADMTLAEDSGFRTVPIGPNTRNFTANILPPSATDHTVTWSILEGANHGTLTVTSAPMQGPQQVQYTAPATMPSPTNGYCTIRCVSNAAPGVSKNAFLYFGEEPTGVIISPSNADVVLGQQQFFTATVQPPGAPQFVNWQVLGTGTGSIDNAGRYTAPTMMPGSGRTVTIRATSTIKPSISSATSMPPDAAVNLQPLPSSCLVTTQTGGSPGPSQVPLSGTLQLQATIDPPDAPQQVIWSIFWNGSSQGSGSSTVGTVTSTGFYTAPFNLPTPSQVYVRATSQFAPSVSDEHQIDLFAPPPTDFQVTPAAAMVSAGGAGVDFNAINFNPPNANPSVAWSINPVFGMIDGNTGFYTPPPNSSTTTIVTVIATSTVATPMLSRTAQITVTPNQQTPPTSLTINPGGGRTFVSGRELVFTAMVLPSGASQSVSWSRISGNGSIDSSGKFTPPTSGDFDTQTVIRATSTADSQIWDEVTIFIDGKGDAGSVGSDLAMGRHEPYGCFDSSGRGFFMGGVSEATAFAGAGGTPKHDDVGFNYDFSGGTWGTLPRINITAQTANTITCCYDSNNRDLYAFVGNGGSAIGIYRMDTAAGSPTWQAVSAGGSGGDKPTLSAGFSYLAFYDPPSEEIRICVGTSIYRLDVSSPSSLDWLNKKSNVNGSTVNPVTEKCAYAYDSNNGDHILIGATTGATPVTKVWRLNDPTLIGSWSWTEPTTTGVGPAFALESASAIFHNGSLWVFGGRDPGAVPAVYKNDAYWLDTNGTPYIWSNPIAVVGRKPPPRAKPALVTDGGATVRIFGGHNLAGAFGDLWEVDLFSGGYTQPSPMGIVPQGRKFAATAWSTSDNSGYMFGGLCDHGTSDELWRMEFNAGKNGVDWYLMSNSGLLDPPGLQGASLVWDSQNDKLLLFGGNRAGVGLSGLQNALYRYDTSTFAWSLPTQSGSPPAVRQYHSACFDSTNNRMIIFGGHDGNATTPFRNDILYFEVQTGLWVTPTITVGSIEGRANAHIGHDPAGARILVLGGVTQTAGVGSSGIGGTLQLNAFVYGTGSQGSWAFLPTTNPFSVKAINYSGAAYDSAEERFITAVPGDFSTQALVACYPVTSGPPPTWQQLTNGSLTHGIACSGLYDPVHKRFYAVCGETDLGGGKFKKLNQVRITKFQ